MKGIAAPSHCLPTGAVTLWFSDIEGSTKRWEAHGDAMPEALRRHYALMQAAIASHCGHVFKTVGDAFCAVFHTPADAIAAALGAQRAMAHEDWNAVGGLRVRLALHVGETNESDGDYFGPAVNRVARLLSTVHGGQTVVSSAVADRVRNDMPAECSLRDLGVHRLKDLGKGEHVYQLVAPDLRAEFPPLRSLDTLSNNLPLQLTSFVGRNAELGEIKALLADSRLVTLLGPGGIGKTRAALQIAADALESFPDGVWFVDLASIGSPQQVLSSLAEVFDVEDISSRSLSDHLVMALKKKKALIILDNCEHVIGAAADLAARVLEHCPGIRFLATSREPLNTGGERRYRLPSLSVPDRGGPSTAKTMGEYAAVALFVERARRVVPDFTLNDENAATVAGIVRDLDGIALAIELAAARMTALSLTQLAQRLRQCLRLLTGGNRTALPRQQTLRALIAWSYELLSDAERMLLRRCAVFRGGWTLNALEEVCGSDAGECDVLALTAALVDKSLVIMEVGEANPRYRMLETTRQYAAECLQKANDLPTVSARHCSYFQGQIERLFNSCRKANFDRWLETARSELENYRAAIEWGLLQRNDIEAGATIVACLCPLWFDSFRSEGRALALQAKDALTGDVSMRTRGLVLLAIAYLDMESGRNADAAEAAIAALQGDRDEVYAEALHVCGISLAHAGRLSEALERFNEALVLGKGLELPELIATTSSAMGACAMIGGDWQRARVLLEDSVALSRAQGAHRILTLSLQNLAELQFSEGDYQGAIQRVREAEAVDREFGCDRSLMFGLVNLAAYLLVIDQVPEAWHCAREALEIAIRSQQPLQAAWAVQHLAQIATLEGRCETAARLLAYVDGVCAREGTVREPNEQAGYERTVTLLRAALPLERLERLMHQDFSLCDDETAFREALGIPEPAH